MKNNKLTGTYSNPPNSADEIALLSLLHFCNVAHNSDRYHNLKINEKDHISVLPKK